MSLLPTKTQYSKPNDMRILQMERLPLLSSPDFGRKFRVFNALQKPVYDNPMQGILKEFDFKYETILDKLGFAPRKFFKEAVLNGSFRNDFRGKIAKNTKD